jgi:hypothetical protein
MITIDEDNMKGSETHLPRRLQHNVRWGMSYLTLMTTLPFARPVSR